MPKSSTAITINPMCCQSRLDTIAKERRYNRRAQRELDEKANLLIEVENHLYCPISQELMRDPVILWPSNQTYDRESICRALLYQHDQDPLSGKRYHRKLKYKPDYRCRALLELFHGKEWTMQRYDDSLFLQLYDAMWDE